MKNYPNKQNTHGIQRINNIKMDKNRKTNKNIEYADIEGRMKEYATDQNGSRFIQYFFETSSWDQKSVIFSELVESTSELAMDPFGNYVIQRILEHGNYSHRRTIADQLIGHI